MARVAFEMACALVWNLLSLLIRPPLCVLLVASTPRTIADDP